jgi:hypothetical protein
MASPLFLHQSMQLSWPLAQHTLEHITLHVQFEASLQCAAIVLKRISVFQKTTAALEISGPWK